MVYARTSSGIAPQTVNFGGDQSSSRYRALDPSIGRWTRQDPIGYLDGANTYLYEGGRPVGSLDPKGLYTVKECADLAASLAGTLAELESKLGKYDPIEDAKGGHAIPEGKGGGTTKPGGHYNAIQNARNRAVAALERFTEGECWDKVPTWLQAKMSRLTRVVQRAEGIVPPKLATAACKVAGVGRFAKILGPIFGYLGYEAARAEGASVPQAIAVGGLEAINPLPWSVLEARDALENGAAASQRALCENRRNRLIRQGYTGDMIPSCDHTH